MRAPQTISERIDSKMLKCYGHVVRMGGNRLPKPVMGKLFKEGAKGKEKTLGGPI